ncbi:helix-turn-helix transcriptional regulator [Agrobacterium rhizogenes]|uniref:HTH luxR-type domain-containing protein n=1 Tax=Rhizobium rhizogenes NBRC 13257 TaxID=1220581 RepID=A0AA87QIB4_RHIRH|nr:helix-turn-helix transcriptional regulator [Rhizobium rhizogenes]NTG65113.1 helix-turn-helix transcriptional regulator [Rhizobium rhizogenes]NTG71564.1 helix-turn-helix transcriptional regulator [Rhizobium rhizogenes]NTG84463.1 helix-turn-helix transcriptional regulator [Rhizobium rhizogenes]NTG90857.1 helix-turn-helix transcriptional regulator [Rhizobium rhizogenes]NTH29491.1 helix-turn-helix transcriptional regulator [Rhizobium rhizogenes]
MGYLEPRPRLRDITLELYRAALQPEPLESWSRSISNLLDTEIAGLTVLAPSGLAVQMGSVGSDLEAGREYLEKYQHINPLRPFWQSAPSGEVFRIDSNLIDDKFRSSEFYSRYCQNLDLGGGICMLLSIRTAKVLVHASQPRKPELGPIEHELLACLRDDLLLCFEIAGTLMLATNVAENIIRSFDQKGIGVALLTEDGRVEHVNGSMNEMLHAGGVLRMEQGRLAPGSAIRLPELPGMVNRTKKSGVGGRLFYGDKSSDRCGSIIAYPVPMAFDWEGPHENKVVLLVTDSSRPKGLLTERLRKAYGLTQAETGVAGKLLDGKTSRHIATQLGVQINSVRAHLKAIYAKTGTHSQVELLKLLQIEKENT